jgi:hypothetical protein
MIADAFARVLQGIHHPRIKYPGEEEPSKKQESPASQPAAAGSAS